MWKIVPSCMEWKAVGGMTSSICWTLQTDSESLPLIGIRESSRFATKVTPSADVVIGLTHVAEATDLNIAKRVSGMQS